MKTGKISLLEYLKEDKAYKNFNEKKSNFFSSSEALALIVALSYKENPRKMVFLFQDIYEATAFNQFLGDYLDEDEVYFYPHDDIFHLSALGVSYEMKDERMLAISSTLKDSPSILVTHVSGYKLNICKKEEFVSNSINLKVGQLLDVEALLLKLSKIGYIKTDHIQQSSQVAKRGMILDVFDPCYNSPIRIEFFGDEIEDIRIFKLNDELSFSHLKEIVLHPSSIRLLNEKSKYLLDEIKSNFDDKKFLNDENRNSIEEIISSLYLKLDEGFLNEADNRFYFLLTNNDNDLSSYLTDYEKYVYKKDEIIFQENLIKEKEDIYFSKSVKEFTSIDKERIYSDTKINLDDFVKIESDPSFNFSIRDNGYKAISYQDSYQVVSNYLKDGYKVRIALNEPNLSNYANILTEHQIPFTYHPIHSDVLLYDGNITHGFEIEKYKRVYLSAKEIFGISNQKSRFLSRYKEAKIIRRYDDIKVGDYVVHEIHGIGRYLGVVKMDSLEYLKIEYAGNAFFFLPLNQYKMIRKFSSRDGYTPSLDKLGGSTWSRKKAAIRSKIAFIADQLLEIYSKRSLLEGYQFKDEIELENQFLNSFLFKHTNSQLAAINEVFKDMSSSTPMDRLIAGDVGFGKTEVAFNAAFKAILNNKQVAFLCPTTILSMQHYKVAKNRFSSFGVKICLFNRFISKKEQDNNIKLIKEGKIDLVIGTHRLLSDKIEFKDLGLLIIDEEQKFGVTHKEKIKTKSTNIDCLTLTATPIPRTLESSLLNIKSLSLLKEAPINRMPVKTYVTKYNFSLIIEVIEKELNRKGQVYFLHNDIASINSIASKLQKNFKNKKILVCHAKMSEIEIEDTMNAFYEGRADILVCTSIIESGLDIPNVNTIIVDKADRFGLAQLYQIKGRVGRSDRLAYAYFLYSDENKITDDAKKRLKALTDFTELGSGYKIAMQDLNIRGAGDILGAKQSGFVDSLGYDAYVNLLKEVIKEKTFKEEAVKENSNKYELSFSLDSAIPSSYADEKSRINMYQELSECNSKDDLIKFVSTIKDIYGQFPREVNNLLIKREIEIFLNSDLISSFKEGLGIYLIITSKKFSTKNHIYDNLKEELEGINIHYKVRVINNLFAFELIKTNNYLNEFIILINTIKKAYDD